MLPELYKWYPRKTLDSHMPKMRFHQEHPDILEQEYYKERESDQVIKNIMAKNIGPAEAEDLIKREGITVEQHHSFDPKLS
jgi:hypothetical protein